MNSDNSLIEKRLSDIGEIVTGFTPSTSNTDFWNGDIPFYSPSDIDEKIIVKDADKKVSKLGSSFGRTIPEGAVMVTCIGSIGKMAICGFAGITNQQINTIVVGRGYDSRYVYYVILNGVDRLINIAPTTTIPILNKSEFGKFKFQFHSFKKQQKIAKILTTVDNLIEQTQALIDKYTAIKQGMMADLFTRGIDLSGTPETNPNHGQLRPSFEEAPELYKETELEWVPREWEVTTIGACCEISNNLRKPISAEEREYIKGEYAYYGCTGILDFIDEYRVDGKYVIIGEDGDHFLKFSRQEMTLLISGRFNVNNHAHIVSGGASCLTEWFHCYFVHRDITYYLTRQGAGRFKLKKETLLQMPMILPNLIEQAEIYFRYTSINEKQKKEKVLLSKLILQKKGLMQDLLTGKVQVTA